MGAASGIGAGAGVCTGVGVTGAGSAGRGAIRRTGGVACAWAVAQAPVRDVSRAIAAANRHKRAVFSGLAAQSVTGDDPLDAFGGGRNVPTRQVDKQTARCEDDEANKDHQQAFHGNSFRLRDCAKPGTERPEVCGDTVPGL